MALPDLGGIGSKGRVSKLGQSVSKAVSPSKLILQSASTVKAKLDEEVNFSSFGSFFSDLADDIKGSFSRIESGSPVDPAQKQAAVEQTQKLTRITDNTRETSDSLDTLLEVIKIVDYNLFQLLEKSDLQIDTLRELTGISQNASSISRAQLDALKQYANNPDLIPAERARVEKQSPTNKKIKFNVREPSTIRNTLESISNETLSVVGGITEALGVQKALPEKIVKAIDKSQSKFYKKRQLAEERIQKRNEHFRQQMLRDEKTGKFRRATREERQAFNEEFNAKFKKSDSDEAEGKTKFNLGGIGNMLKIAGIFLAITGGLQEAFISFLNGDEIKTIVANAVKGMIVYPLQTVADLITDFIGADKIDISKFYDETVTPLASEIFSLGKDAFTFIREQVRIVYQGITETIPNLLGSVGTLVYTEGEKFVTNVKDFVSEKWKIVQKAIGTFKTIIENIINTFKSISSAAFDLLPEPLKRQLSKDDNIQPNKVSKNLQSKPAAAEQAAKIVIGQQSIDQFKREKDLKPSLDEQMMNQYFNNPITQNISNTTYVPSNIITRNPESPVFLQNKVMF